jgi:hypothetical protein
MARSWVNFGIKVLLLQSFVSLIVSLKKQKAQRDLR